jgi:hypothetical protein
VCFLNFQRRQEEEENEHLRDANMQREINQNLIKIEKHIDGEPKEPNEIVAQENKWHYSQRTSDYLRNFKPNKFVKENSKKFSILEGMMGYVIIVSILKNKKLIAFIFK